MYRITVIIFLLLPEWVLSQTEKNIPDPNLSAQVISECKKTLLEMNADIKQFGFPAEMNYLDTSKDFFWLPPGYVTPINFDTVFQILGRNSMIYSSVDNSFDSLFVRPINSELASYYARIHSVMKKISGETLEVRMNEVGTMIKRKDGWKLLNGHTVILKGN